MENVVKILIGLNLLACDLVDNEFNNGMDYDLVDNYFKKIINGLSKDFNINLSEFID